MAVEYIYNVPLSSISTFRIGGVAKKVAILRNESDIVEFFNSEEGKNEVLVLGGGSNVVFSDFDLDKIIVFYKADDVLVLSEDDNSAQVSVLAGTNWDDFVACTVDKGFSGLEALSAIPGTVGATPVQNVGAYGSEIKDTLEYLKAFDIEKNEFVEISNKGCKFSYRDSIFKNEARGRYLIVQLVFRLSKDEPDVPQYLGVSEYLAENNIKKATLKDIRNAIIAIRSKKLPDPKDIASCGSFFKNPIVSTEIAKLIKEKFPTVVIFPIDDKKTKIGAGSMIDTLGWKGKRIGNFSFYKGNAMVVVNEGGGTRSELENLIEKLNDELYAKYGIKLEPEPEML